MERTKLIIIALGIILFVSSVSAISYIRTQPAQSSCYQIQNNQYQLWLQSKGFSVECKEIDLDATENMPKIDLVSLAQKYGQSPPSFLLEWLHNQHITMVYQQPGLFWWIYSGNLVWFQWTK